MSQYVVITPDGKRFGPTDFPTLTQWAHEGRIAPGMMVEDVLTGTTMVASSVPGLFGSETQSSYAPYTRPPMAATASNGTAVASLVLGCIGLLAWCLPIVGFPIGVAGVVCGVRSLNSSSRTLAIAGLILSIICLVLSILNGILGAIMAVNGLERLGLLFA